MKNQTESVNWSKLPSFTDYRRVRLMQLPPKKTAATEQKTSEKTTEVKNDLKPRSPKPEH